MHLAEKIYSLHKSSTDNFIKKTTSENNFNTEEILRFDFPLKQTLKHHKRKIHRIKVSCFILFKINNSNIYK
jgi:predicted RNA methylase